ncbi:uncharacterized protein [Apostichopus japonicus]|uniref:uncharacterized protein isoform X2 n=1 Tax=Stichopus japonicus TaxID=307972 RepID=UPI003AB26FCD
MMSSQSDAKRVFLWIVPRTCSTAFSKFMTFVDDTEVWMEPYLASHFNETFYNPNFRVGDPHAERMRERLARNEASDFMKGIRETMKNDVKENANVIDQKEISYSWGKQQLEKPTPKKIIFIKDQALAIIDHLSYLPDVTCRHSFIIRHPAQAYTSFKEMIRNRLDPDGMDWEECHVGNDTPFFPVKDFYKIQHNLWQHLLETSEVEPVIIDADDLLTKPEVILSKYFEKLGIPFKESYLQWEDSDDFIRQKWKGSGDFVLLEPKTIVYSRAVKSTGFEPPKIPRGTSKPEWKVTPELKEYIEGALPFYEEMYQNRLK